MYQPMPSKATIESATSQCSATISRSWRGVGAAADVGGRDGFRCGTRVPGSGMVDRGARRYDGGATLRFGPLSIGAQDSMNAKAVCISLCTISLALVAPAPAASAAVPRNVAYVSTPEGITVIDLARLAPVSEIDVGGKGPRGLAITPDGRYLLTANEHTADVSVIDTATAQVVRRIHIGKNPEFMRIEP